MPVELYPPLAWSRRSRIMRLFLGDKSYFSICKQLRERNENEVKLYWDRSILSDIHKTVSEIIKEEFNWPNTLFAPQDPCEILFWEHSTECSEISALICIDNSILMEEAEHRKFWDELNKLNYGDFLSLILQERNCQGKGGVPQNTDFDPKH